MSAVDCGREALDLIASPEAHRQVPDAMNALEAAFGRLRLRAGHRATRCGRGDVVVAGLARDRLRRDAAGRPALVEGARTMTAAADIRRQTREALAARIGRSAVVRHDRSRFDAIASAGTSGFTTTQRKIA